MYNRQMTTVLNIHSTHPQGRLIDQVVRRIEQGAVIVYPTDSGYAFGAHIGDKAALEKIQRIRQLNPRHHFTLMCRNLSEVAVFARVDNPTFRILKAHTPGPYTFILEATREVPKRVQQVKRKTIGVRIPDSVITLAILNLLNQPLLSTSLILPGSEHPLSDPHEIIELLGRQVDLIIDSGVIPQEETSIIDLTATKPEVLRQGKGDIEAFL